SEVISLLANSVPVEDIAAGLIQAVARRVGNMAKRLGVEPVLVFSGGVAKNKGVRKAMEEIIGYKFADLNFDPQLIGAYGAAVLACGDTKSIKVKKEQKTLQTNNKLNYLLQARPDEITSMRESGGKTLGYFCSYVPEEIVHAMGITPIRLIRGGNVEASNVGNTYLTQNSCPFAASCIGFKDGNYDFYFSSMDLIADAPSCYQMKRVLEVWEKYFNSKIIHIGFPRNFYEENGIKYFMETLFKFIEELEIETKRKLNSLYLGESVLLYNSIRDKQRLLYQHLKFNRINWSELIPFIHAGFVLDKQMYLSLLNELIAEIEKRPKIDINLPLRILVTGGMMAPGDEKLIKIFNSLEMDFAMDELCAGSRNIYRNIEAPNIENIARAYLSNVPCGALPYPYPDSDPRLKHIEKLIKEYQINGILYYTLRFCDAYSYKAKQIKEFCEKLNIPFLHLHSDFSTSDEGQLKTRVEAFKESILAMK
ncbi:MAG: 2-hydroxyacyl-CoA dehydratase, partial [Candidatus Firestonebacteria bacterium]|nr:2-hydroxyacyl-CoA dehydratase [Candidatus Firestonebacteria bacterium]